MKSVILCEGGTDLTLIQYFMEVANDWVYNNKVKGYPIKNIKSQKAFTKNANLLSIAETGGCSKLCPCLEQFIKRIKLSATSDEMVDRLVIISDRDEIETVGEFLDEIGNILSRNNVQVEDFVEDRWIDCNVQNGAGQNVQFKILLLLIPFEETGALETFLLDAISASDEYDKNIIDKGKAFVNDADPESRYLSKRRYKTKAEFDVYFSIRTAVEQFAERQRILRNVQWEEYKVIQTGFKLLEDLA